jgi:predicted N-acyltransferase
MIENQLEKNLPQTKEELISQFGDNILVYGCFKENQLLATVTCLHFAEKLNALSYGIDYKTSDRMSLYQNLCIYHLIEYSIAHNISQIDYGIEAFEAKSASYFKREPLYMAFLPSSKILTNELTTLRESFKCLDENNHIYFTNLEK